MNAPFKAASDAYPYNRQRHQPLPSGSGPTRKSLMLVILVVVAVFLSLIAESLYSYVQSRNDADWVRSDVREHRAIIRTMGKVTFKPIKLSERQMNEAFKVASDRAW
ncbi:hypothetical protein [Rhizobium sp. S96]|nr:hypothetical protein [Rhizobium sp. S96]MDM9622615.1 hypothetical protein [Rhizobium sp. S96]